jgi:hypothetical protein
MTLAIVNVVASGILRDDAERAGLVRLLGPEGHVARTFGAKTGVWVPVRATVQGNSANLLRATLLIGGHYGGHVWADQHAVRIEPGRHWLFTCMACDRPARVLLWPPGGHSWCCRSCLKPRYAQKPAALRPSPDLVVIDALLDDLLRLQRVARRRERFI